MNGTESANNIFGELIIPVSNVASAVLYTIPVFMSLIYKFRFIFLVFCTACVISILYAAIIFQQANRIEDTQFGVFSILNSLTGVLIALTVGITTGLYKSLFGILRVIWLVVIVTASSSYAFFQTSLGASFLPNDVTFIALITSSLLLLIVFIANKLGCCRHSSKASTLSELFLVIGAFVLRFDADIKNFLNVSIGTLCWNVCCCLSGASLILDLKNFDTEEKADRD